MFDKIFVFLTFIEYMYYEFDRHMLGSYKTYDMNHAVAKNIIRIIKSDREEKNKNILNDEINADIDLLMEATFNRGKNESDLLNKISDLFLTKSFHYINVLALNYYNQTNRSLHYAIEKIFITDDCMIKDIIKYSQNPAFYIADRIKHSTKGLSTKTDYLNFLVLISCEENMVAVKDEYQQAFGESLRSLLQKKTTKSHRHALYELLGEEKYDDD